MAKVKGALFSITAGGKLGNGISFQGGPSGTRAQLIPTHRDMQTAGQMSVRGSFQSAVSAWNALDGASKAYYETLAAGQAITGYNLYVKLFMLGQIEGPPAGGTYTLQPADKDTELVQASPTVNYGSGTYFYLADYTVSARRPVLEISLVTLPDDLSVVSAVLSLYFYDENYTNPVGKTVYANRLTRDNWVELEATWNKYTTALSWTAPGGDYTATGRASTTMPANPGAWIEFNVKTLVEDAIANRNDLLELLLKYDVEDQGEGYSQSKIYSSQYTGDLTKRPKLVVEMA